jgi:hypothetical protein
MAESGSKWQLFSASPCRPADRLLIANWYFKMIYVPSPAFASDVRSESAATRRHAFGCFISGRAIVPVPVAFVRSFENRSGTRAVHEDFEYAVRLFFLYIQCSVLQISLTQILQFGEKLDLSR